MKTIAIPVSVFQVDCEIASGRPFAMVERTILRSISAGNDEYERLIEDLGLHPRIVAEALTTLFEAGIIEFRHGTGAFSITPMGQEAIHDADFIPPTLRSVRKPYTIVVERITGLADVGSNLTYERIDELRGRSVSILPPSDIDATPSRNSVRQLIERRLQAGEWVRSVGHPDSIYRYSSCVQLDLREGRLEGIRSPEWVRGLTLALRERGFNLAEPDPLDPDVPWVGVAWSDVRAVRGADEHSVALHEILERSSTYVFIHSAFLTGSRASELAGPIAQALRRGVDVLIARGGTEEPEASDKEGVDVFKKLAYDERTARGRFFFERHPTGSHAKVLVRDAEEVFDRLIQLVERPA
jgi:predicted transcriptional regulator